MWTKEQLMAINEQDKNIIVSAGAGSGKTAVLTQRILRHVKEGVSLNSLLVLTFTNAAAKEMKERIRAKLIENNLTQHIEVLEQSYITTFDAYSLALCKKYFYKLNVSPDISVLSNEVSYSVKKDIIEKIFEELYEVKDENFLRFLNNFTTKDDKFLVDLILTISQKVSLKQNVDVFLDEYINVNYDDNLINQYLSDYIKLIYQRVYLIKQTATELFYLTDSEKLKIQLQELSEADFDNFSYNDLKAYFNDFKLQRLEKNASDEVKDLKNILKKEIDDFIDEFLKYDNEQQMKNQVRLTKSDAALIILLVKQTLKRVADYNKTIDSYEFIDIAKMAIRLVTEFEDVKEEIKTNLKEILIDEYQDTSDLQELFISQIAKDNVYMVGDIKQSIYRFRNANPYIFKKKYSDYEKQSGGIKIDLNNNFRSRKEVLDNINQIFGKIMSLDYGDASYNEGHKMHYGNLSYDVNKDLSKDYNMQLLTYNDIDKQYTTYKDFEKEAFIIASDIKSKLAGLTFDKQLRKAKYSDFAILINKGSHFFDFKRILESQGIPVSIHADISLKNSMLGKIIGNLLSLVIHVKENNLNKNYFYYFTSIARSFLFEFDDSLIYKIVKDKSIDNIVYQKAKAIANMIDNNASINVYQKVLEEFNVYEKIPIISEVHDLLVQLEFFYNTIKSLSDIGYTFSKIRLHLDEILKNSGDVKYPLKTGNQDSVVIMTVHKSKGLEFPICYFPCLHNSFNLSDSKDYFLYSNKYEIILPYYDEGQGKHIVHTLNKYHNLKEEISERIRLFYVALTRAKEQFVMIYRDDLKYQEKHKNPANFSRFAHMIFAVIDDLDYCIKNIDLSTLKMNKDYLKTKYSKNYISENKSLTFKNLNLQYQEVTKLQISKKVNSILDKNSLDNIKLGLDFHQYLEYLDIKNLDTTYINIPPFMSDKINNIFHLEIFKDIKKALVFKEYEFMTMMNNTSLHGIIDLMLVYDTHIDIIDYKLSNIDLKEYENQLMTYKKYIENKTNKTVNIYLLSILKEQVVKINL